MRATSAAVLAVALACPVCAASAGEAERVERVGTSRQGTRGIDSIETAQPLPFGDLILSGRGEYFRSTGFFAAGDRHKRAIWRGMLAFSPYGPFDLAVSWSSTLNRNTALQQATQALGDPTLALKASFPLVSGLAVGASAQLVMPTSEDGQQFASDALSFTGLGIVSYDLSPSLVLACNAGYRLDNSRKLFVEDFPAEQATMMRFVADVATANQIIGGVGALGRVAVSDAIFIAPYLEVNAAFAPGTSGENPLRASVGVKTMLGARGLVELSVGGDYRLSGAPKEGGKLPGLPPWQVHAALALHMSTLGAPVAAPHVCEASPACDAEHPCAAGLSCLTGHCGIIKEVAKEVVKEVVKDKPTFILAGTVTDVAAKRPLAGATVQMTGFEGTALTTDKDGKFKSWPLVVDEGILQLSVAAPGYRPTQQTVAKGPVNETKAIDLPLVPADKQTPGQLKGQLKDEASGKPVAGLVVIPALNKKIKAAADGGFEAELVAGRYDVMISSPRYTTQTKSIVISSGEVVILNIDMAKRR